MFNKLSLSVDKLSLSRAIFKIFDKLSFSSEELSLSEKLSLSVINNVFPSAMLKIFD